MNWTRLERRRRLVSTACLAFSLGALTAGGLTRRLDRLASSADSNLAAATTIDEPAAVPTPPRPPTRDALPAGTTGSTTVVSLLKSRRLEVPVEGISRNQLRDTFDDGRAAGLRKHEAIDIMAPRGTRVRSVEDGRVAKLFTSVAGGLTAYVFDPTETFVYYYAHLDRYAAGLREGEPVKRGDLIAYVGSTGNAAEDAPHLHFAIFQLGQERQWWKGDPINPYDVLH